MAKKLENTGSIGFEEKIWRAADMLRDAGTKTYDIAYYIGYDNPKSFSRAFRNYYGRTPSEYRKGAEHDP